MNEFCIAHKRVWRSLTRNAGKASDIEAFSADELEDGWLYRWESASPNLQMLYRAVRYLKPKTIIETGTFQGHGTHCLAAAADANKNSARLITIDYDVVPTEVRKEVVARITEDQWKELRDIRERNLSRIRNRFRDCTIAFVGGDTREVLPGLLADSTLR